MQRAEIVTVERRRRWSLSDKRQIVDETLAPGASVSSVARRYGMHASQVFAWRRALRGQSRAAPGAASGAFAPVVVAAATATMASGRMEIVLRSGRRIVVDAGVDAAALGRIIAVLEAGR